MYFKEMTAFKRLPHTSHPDIRINTISILSSEDRGPSRSPTPQYIGKLKERFLDLIPKYTGSEWCKGRMLESEHQWAYKIFPTQIKCENYYLVGN